MTDQYFLLKDENKSRCYYIVDKDGNQLMNKSMSLAKVSSIIDNMELSARSQPDADNNTVYSEPPPRKRKSKSTANLPPLEIESSRSNSTNYSNERVIEKPNPVIQPNVIPDEPTERPKMRRRSSSKKSKVTPNLPAADTPYPEKPIEPVNWSQTLRSSKKNVLVNDEQEQQLPPQTNAFKPPPLRKNRSIIGRAEKPGVFFP